MTYALAFFLVNLVCMGVRLAHKERPMIVNVIAAAMTGVAIILRIP